MTIRNLHNLKGNVSVVTGGARHLGRDAAEVLAEAGCDLVITSRNIERAKVAAKQLQEQCQVDVLPQRLEVSDYGNVSKVMDQVNLWKGHLDILVTNAGGDGGRSSPFV